MSKPIEIDLTNQGDRAPAFGTALSSADADQAASRLAPDGLQSTGAVEREEKDVWVVWNKNGRSPRFFHANRDGAEAEATRLALKVPGRKFLVLHMVSKFGVAANG